METVVKRLYEGMFLIDSALAASDWEGVNNAIKTVLDRAGAEVVSQQKWDERKLAYDIGRMSRGTYILTYFRVEGSKIKGIERDVQLSEIIMRAMILNAEHMSPEDLEKETPAMAVERAEKEREARVQEAIEAEKAEQAAKEEQQEETEAQAEAAAEPEETSVEEGQSEEEAPEAQVEEEAKKDQPVEESSKEQPSEKESEESDADGSEVNELEED